jgi:hypothetical protein
VNGSLVPLAASRRHLRDAPLQLVGVLVVVELAVVLAESRPG